MLSRLDFLHERLGWKFVIGTALALLGCAILAGAPAPGDTNLEGAALALFAAIFYAGYLLLMKAARRSADSISTVFLATLSAAATLGVYGVLLGNPFSGFPAQSWAMMAAAAVVSQIGGVLGIVWALRFVPATVASVVLLAQPVGTAALGWWLLGEAMSPTQMAGGLTVLTGIALVSTAAAARERSPAGTGLD